MREINTTICNLLMDLCHDDALLIEIVRTFRLLGKFTLRFSQLLLVLRGVFGVVEYNAIRTNRK